MEPIVITPEQLAGRRAALKADEAATREDIARLRANVEREVGLRVAKLNMLAGALLELGDLEKLAVDVQSTEASAGKVPA